MNRTVDGGVPKDVDTVRDVEAASPDLTVNHEQLANGARSAAQEPLPSEAVSHQVVVGDIPQESPGFGFRAGLLDRTEARVLVIHPTTGLPGLGTTQIAAAYARAKLADDWRLVAWVNAADAGSLQTGLAAVAEATGLTDGGSERDIADASRAVRHLLETDGDRCLLVFDDVPDPEALRPFVPADGMAQVLITSIRRPSANLATAVPLDVFGADEALSFLTRRTGLNDEAGAAAVAAVLGYLPLALALAAPVIRGHRHGYARYLDRLQTIPIRVSLTGDDGVRYPHDVVRAVLLSLAEIRAADQTGMCTRVMQILAVLSAARIAARDSSTARTTLGGYRWPSPPVRDTPTGIVCSRSRYLAYPWRCPLITGAARASASGRYPSTAATAAAPASSFRPVRRVRNDSA